MQDTIQDTLNSLKLQLETYSKEYKIQEKANYYTSKTKDTIQKHPIPSLLAGLAIGFLIGKLLSDSDTKAD